MQLPGVEPGLLWTSRFSPRDPRLLPGPDPGLLFAELGLGESVEGEDKSARADLELTRTGPALEESEVASGSGLGLLALISVAVLESRLSLEPIPDLQ